jgi:hypothetical protein
MSTHNLSGSIDAFEDNPDQLRIIRDAGITDVWIAGFLYGHWYYSIDRIASARRMLNDAGLAAHVINVPLGHPGDALGSESDDVPLVPPDHWKCVVNADGSRRYGTSLHEPATAENITALRAICELGVDKVFLDDDFRLASAPGVIGGCFCEQHKADFLRTYGYSERTWDDLLNAVAGRQLVPVLRDWVDFTCRQLSESFFAQQAAVPQIKLGNMVMYMGSEKAGIKLADYRGVMLRVGEGHFDDSSFGETKGKTVELFSVLFHRRYVEPELAYSETTAYPADQLSAANMAAKLNICLIGDVRNTMYMSGLTPFSITHWDTLGPAMKKVDSIGKVIAGHKPAGPFKHYWGEAGRYVSDDNPYSLFLATGVPFEVTDEPSSSGWTFLADADAQSVDSGSLVSQGTTFVTRRSDTGNCRAVPETLEDLFAFKKEIAPALEHIPHVVEDLPVVCAWYPDIQRVLVWNLSEQRQSITLRYEGALIPISIEPLGAELVRYAG